MKTEIVNEVFSIVEAKLRSRPSPHEFEMAYQARVAMDRIRFAIKATEQSAQHPEQLQEAGFQLLDALDRLESAERDFQMRFRKPPVGERRNTVQSVLNGHVKATDGGAV